MLQTFDHDRLRTDLALIDTYFPELAAPPAVDAAGIAAYYDQSFWGYSLLHSRDGAVHLAMGEGAGRTREDFLGHAREVAGFAEDVPGGATVLEVGSGRGFNLEELARRFPGLNWRGIDLSPSHLKAAQKRLAPLPNASVAAGDFHDLSEIESGSVALIYAVETLCHSTNPARMLRELARVLMPGGRLVIYDVYRARALPDEPDLQTAMAYAEASMAVPIFVEHAEFLRRAAEGGFKVLGDDDRTDDVMPNALRLQARARRFFQRPVLSRAIRWLAPRALTRNTAAGLFMATTLRVRAHSYRRLVFETHGS